MNVVKRQLNNIFFIISYLPYGKIRSLEERLSDHPVSVFEENDS